MRFVDHAHRWAYATSPAAGRLVPAFMAVEMGLPSMADVRCRDCNRVPDIDDSAELRRLLAPNPYRSLVKP